MVRVLVGTMIGLFVGMGAAHARAADRTTNVRVRQLRAVGEKLKPLHQPLGKPQPGDWLWAHREPGQTFLEYLQCRPITPTGDRQVIYVQPLGDFTKKQREIG